MASTIGAWSYVKSDGSLSTKDDVNASVSSTGKNTNTSSSKTTLDVDQFLQLMVAEMQNQDPLEPTDNSDYMAQLATFTQVEATKEMNTNTLQGMASDLVGKQVIMITNQNSDGFIGGTVGYIAGSKVGEAVVKGAQKIRDGAIKVAKKIVSGVKTVGSAIVSGVKSLCSGIASFFGF